MPEATMNEDNGSVFGQDKIGSAGEFPVMQSIPKSAFVERVSQEQFRPGILASNAGHHPRTGLLVDDVGHVWSLDVTDT